MGSVEVAPDSIPPQTPRKATAVAVVQGRLNEGGKVDGAWRRGPTK